MVVLMLTTSMTTIMKMVVLTMLVEVVTKLTLRAFGCRASCSCSC